MTMESVQAVPETTTLGWDVGTAYELFVSLSVLHEPDHYDLRPSWAAKIRSRIPTAERTFLEEIQPFISFPLGWIHRLPQPKNAITVLYALQQIPAAQRGIQFLDLESGVMPAAKILLEVARQRRWDKKQLAELVPLMCHEEHGEKEQGLIQFLNWWVRPDDFGTMLYSALQAYHSAFFEQEEQRVAPVLQAGLARAKELATHSSIPDLIAELSQGIRYTEPLGKELIVVPAYWTTPLVILQPISLDRKIFLFGGQGGSRDLGQRLPQLHEAVRPPVVLFRHEQRDRRRIRRPHQRVEARHCKVEGDDHPGLQVPR